MLYIYICTHARVTIRSTGMCLFCIVIIFLFLYVVKCIDIGIETNQLRPRDFLDASCDLEDSGALNCSQK